MPPLVLSNRKCGRVRGGGLYATGVLSPEGTLLPFTAIAAPFEAHVPNPRAPAYIDVPATLQRVGLVSDAGNPAYAEPFAKLPRLGIVDLWGMSAGYETAWDVIEETCRLGISRRIAQVPSLQVPYPVLMAHKNAVVDFAHLEFVDDWLRDWAERQPWGEGMSPTEPGWGYEYDTGKGFSVLYNEHSWLGAESLGRVGDDDYLWHHYVDLLWAVGQLTAQGVLDKFLHETGSELREGVFGLSWVTAIAYVLKPHETEVPEHLAEKGVVAAVPEGDPRGLIAEAEEA